MDLIWFRYLAFRMFLIPLFRLAYSKLLNFPEVPSLLLKNWKSYSIDLSMIQNRAPWVIYGVEQLAP